MLENITAVADSRHHPVHPPKSRRSSAVHPYSDCPGRNNSSSVLLSGRHHANGKARRRGSGPCHPPPLERVRISANQQTKAAAKTRSRDGSHEPPQELAKFGTTIRAVVGAPSGNLQI
jgi:hypothetical protein